MIMPTDEELAAEIAALRTEALAAQALAAQLLPEAKKVAFSGSIGFKGLGGENLACERLLLRISRSGVALTSLDRLRTSVVFPEGTIFYTVAGTQAQLDAFQAVGLDFDA